MSTPTLHYVYDPLCGWCYGAAPLVRAARGTIRVQAHGGDMMAGAARRAVTAEWRKYCNVNSESERCRGMLQNKKKALER